MHSSRNHFKGSLCAFESHLLPQVQGTHTRTHTHLTKTTSIKLQKTSFIAEAASWAIKEIGFRTKAWDLSLGCILCKFMSALYFFPLAAILYWKILETLTMLKDLVCPYFCLAFALHLNLADTHLRLIFLSQIVCRLASMI